MSMLAPLLLEAERCLEGEDLDRAAELYRRAHDLDAGRSSLPTVGLARIAILLGRSADAAALLDRVLAEHPPSAEALTLRGVAGEAQGQLDACLATHRRAVALGPDFGPAWFNLGRVEARLHHWREAREALETASRLMPEHLDVQLALGIVTFRAGDLAEALRLLGGCLQRAPGKLDTYLTLAEVLVEAGQLALADDLLENASHRCVDRAEIPSMRAAVAIRQANGHAALSHARRQVELAPEDERAWLLLSALSLARLDVESAEEAVQRALELNPTNWRAHAQLGGIYETLRLRGPAQVAYRTAVALTDREWRPRNNLGTLLLEEGSPAAIREAQALLEQACALASEAERFVPRYNLALACWKLGERAASERHAREAAHLGPAGDPTVAEARRFLGNFR